MDLARRKELQVHVGQRLVQRADDPDVVVEVDMRALAAHHVDLGEPGELVLANRVLDHLLRRVRIGVGLFVRDRKGAELALHAADVGLVQVQVLDEVDAVVAATHAPREIRELAERENVVALHQRHAVLEVEALSALHLVADGREHVGAFQEGHQRSRSTTA